MTDETTFCPHCGQGTLNSEEKEESQDGECIDTIYYSCGHKYETVCNSIKTLVTTEHKKIVSRGGNKIGKKKQEYEIEERYRNDDREHPGAPTVEFVYINHRANPTSAFHIVKYLESNELKHIDCKTCDNKWQHDSGSPLDSHFALEHYPEAGDLGSLSLKIQCLNCNAKYERYN